MTAEIQSGVFLLGSGLCCEEEEKKNTLLELRSRSRLPEETAVRFLFQRRVLHFILLCWGLKQSAALAASPSPRHRDRTPL